MHIYVNAIAIMRSQIKFATSCGLKQIIKFASFFLKSVTEFSSVKVESRHVFYLTHTVQNAIRRLKAITEERILTDENLNDCLGLILAADKKSERNSQVSSTTRLKKTSKNYYKQALIAPITSV